MTIDTCMIQPRLTVQLSSYSCPIYLYQNLLANIFFLQQHIKASQVLIVTNTTVATHYLACLTTAYAALQCNVVILPDGEIHKNQQSLSIIYDALIANRHHRDTTLVALGGGVIGDITGFAASTYQRGVRYLQVPTTLLAQVDAAIGGKTAINHARGKNMIGSFYQPHAIIIDTKTLLTLPQRELYAGFAEVIKYGILSGSYLFNCISNILKIGRAHV